MLVEHLSLYVIPLPLAAFGVGTSLAPEAQAGSQRGFWQHRIEVAGIP